jgi:archaellum component FlaC
MGIGLWLANRQANQVRKNMELLNRVNNSLSSLKTDLNNNWQAQEMVYINIAIEKYLSEVSNLSSKLSSLYSDIIDVANQIAQEEAAAAAAKK